MVKIILAALAVIAVAWYAFQNMPKTGDAAIDTQLEMSESAVVTDDPELEAMPSTAPDTDVNTLESDINTTVILEEDFSDLE